MVKVLAFNPSVLQLSINGITLYGLVAVGLATRVKFGFTDSKSEQTTVGNK